jgi:hypothetical protein
MGDSNYRYLDQCDGARVVKFPGGTLRAMIDYIRNPPDGEAPIVFNEFKYVFINFALNDAQRPKMQWRQNFRDLLSVLPKYEQGCGHPIIVINGPILSPKVTRAREYGEWLRRKIANADLVNVYFYDWVTPSQNNTFVSANGSPNFFFYYKDNMHVNHFGFKEFYRRWAKTFPEIRNMALTFLSDEERKSGGRRKKKKRKKRKKKAKKGRG